MSASNWVTVAVAILGLLGTFGGVSITGRRADRQRHDDQARDDRLRAEERTQHNVEQWRTERQAVYSECITHLQEARDQLLVLQGLMLWAKHLGGTVDPDKVRDTGDPLRGVHKSTGRVQLVCGDESISGVLDETQGSLKQCLTMAQMMEKQLPADIRDTAFKGFDEGFEAFRNGFANVLEMFRQDLGIESHATQ